MYQITVCFINNSTQLQFFICFLRFLGQMGFFRQLSSTEIFEQVQKFDSELKKNNQRLSNVVMMGMGEPLANYDNVMEAIRRMNTELGIGAR